MSAAFKGATGGLGIELYRGSMAYIQHINDTGGINGRLIRIIAYDDGYNPTTAKITVEAKRFVLSAGGIGTPEHVIESMMLGAKGKA